MCDDAPCADRIFLAPLKRSREFRTLRPRLAGRAPHQPFDSWRDGDGFHFFVFALGDQGTRAGTETVALAVFA
ncbi:MAG: hypothetical protein ACRDHM_01300, partial [Actinomycetota bacterium]